MRFILFVTTFLLLYSIMHLYAFLRARTAFSLGARAGIPLALFMAVMVLCPVLVRFSKGGYVKHRL